MDIKETWINIIHELQNKICAAIEFADGKSKFIEDEWERPEGGGGKTRVISNGNVFEKGGVNTSVVFGDVTPAMQKQLQIEGELKGFYFDYTYKPIFDISGMNNNTQHISIRCFMWCINNTQPS